MKKWMIVSLLALLTMLLVCAACAEDGHNWQWKEVGTDYHIRYCDGCSTHSGLYLDESSRSAHEYTLNWPKQPPKDSNGNPLQTLNGTATCKCGATSSFSSSISSSSAPTCTKSGSVTYGGKTGGRYEHTYTLPALGHDPEPHNAKAPTCTEPGCNAYETCKRAGCNYTTYQEIPALDHDRIISDTKAATCTQKGYIKYVCKRTGCNYTMRVDIPELEHELEPHDAKAATCTEPGCNEYYTCKNCDYTTYQEIDPLEHDLEQHEAKAPTCTEVGWEAYETCKREGCDYTTYQEIPATGHSYAKKVINPTCEKGGYTRYTCEVCGDQYTDQRTARLLHWFGEWAANDDGTHSAACLRKGCDHTGKADCAAQEVKLGDGTLTFCPVCGDTQDGKTFALIEGATAKAVTKHLPLGEPVLRTLEWANDATLLSAGFEYAGKLTQPTGMVEFTLPAALIEGKTLSVLNADGSQTPLACTIDGDTAAFTLDFTDSETPVQLISIVLAA